MHPLTSLFDSVLSLDRQPDNQASPGWFFPNRASGLLSVAAAILDRKGALLQCNVGFSRLLPESTRLLPGANVGKHFVAPRFADLVRAAESSRLAGYAGPLAVGSPSMSLLPLRARVWLSRQGVHLLAEYDIDRLQGMAGRSHESDQHQDLLQALQRDYDQLKLHTDSVVQTSLTDPLTGVGNRRKLDQALVDEISRVDRGGGPLSAIMIDLDLFKRVNDEFGHAAGDGVLVGIAHQLLAHLRASDTIARIGGEEFVVLLPNTKIKNALQKAEVMRSGVAESSPTNTNKKCTASFGVAQLRPSENGASLLHRLDVALYRSKAEGRNRVTSAEVHSVRSIPSPSPAT
ncbi:GGDEF domain-containing protein [Pseudomarimonas arenosa]|nr:GGDEF domain-containing protein [Pseudomarimonas arenosa]